MDNFLDLRKIIYFLKVAETLNFNIAARELHISHQALSKQVGSLEEEIGEKLLERSTTKVRVTEIGRKVYDLYRPLLLSWEQAGKTLESFVEARKKVLRLGYFSGLSYERVIEPVLQYLLEKQPDLKINMLAADLTLLQDLMMNDSVDLVLTHGIHTSDWGGVESVVLRTDPLYILVSENHPWYEKDSVTEEDLKNACFLVYENGRPLYGEGAFFPELPAMKREPAYNLDSYMVILQQGRHFGVVGPSYTRREGNFRLLPLPAPYRRSHMITAMYKKLHPQRETLKNLGEVVFSYSGDTDEK